MNPAIRQPAAVAIHTGRLRRLRRSLLLCCAGLASPPLIMRDSTHGMFHCGRDSLVESACFPYRDGRNSKHPSPVAKWRSSLLSASIASSTYRTGSKPIHYSQVQCPLVYLT